MPSRNTVNVSLTPGLVEFIGERVSSGRFASASEVVRAALRLLQNDEQSEKLATSAFSSKLGGSATRK